MIGIKEFKENIKKGMSYKAPNTMERKSEPIHVGEILKKEFFEPLGLTCSKVAKDIGVSTTTITSLVNKKRALTPKLAVKLAKYFNTTPEYWLKFQMNYDIWKALKEQENKMPI